MSAILPKKPKNKSTWGTRVVRLNFFVRFLEELNIPKRHFKINWPLVEAVFLITAIFFATDFRRSRRSYCVSSYAYDLWSCLVNPVQYGQLRWSSGWAGLSTTEVFLNFVSDMKITRYNLINRWKRLKQKNNKKFNKKFNKKNEVFALRKFSS